MRSRFIVFLISTLGTLWAGAERPPIDAFQARGKMDSLREQLDRAIFPPAEKKAWRDCIRGKSEFLAQGRKSDPAFAEVDSLIKRAKVAHADPEDPAVLALMERKYSLEQGLENGWNAAAKGKNCLAIEEKRRRKLESMLDSNPEYRKWKKVAEPAENPPNPI